MRSKDKEIMDKIMEYIESYQTKYYSSPKFGDIAEAVGTSQATVSRYIRELERRGYLRVYGRKEIKLVSFSDISFDELGRLLTVPLQCSEITAKLIHSIGNDGSGYFMVLMPDDSLRYAGINIGDELLFRCAEQAKSGDIVCVLLDERPFIRRLRKIVIDSGAEVIAFMSESNICNDVYTSNYTILGIAVKLIRTINSSASKITLISSKGQ